MASHIDRIGGYRRRVVGLLSVFLPAFITVYSAAADKQSDYMIVELVENRTWDWVKSKDGTGYLGLKQGPYYTEIVTKKRYVGVCLSDKNGGQGTATLQYTIAAYRKDIGAEGLKIEFTPTFKERMDGLFPPLLINAAVSAIEDAWRQSMTGQDLSSLKDKTVRMGVFKLALDLVEGKALSPPLGPFKVLLGKFARKYGAKIIPGQPALKVTRDCGP